MKGLLNVFFNEENGRTEVTVVSFDTGRPIASATNVSAWAAAVDALTDALLVNGEEVK